MIIIPLPADMSIFKSYDKEISPYLYFYAWIIKQMKFNSKLSEILYDINSFGIPDDKTININAIELCENDLCSLKEIVIDWLKNVHKLNETTTMNVYTFMNINIAPRLATEESKIPGYVYVDEKRLIVNL